METTASHSASTFGTVIATAAIAFGIGYLAVNSVSNETVLKPSCEGDEMDTTERLLSGGNRARTLLALEQYKQGNFVEFALENLEKELA